MPEKCKAETKSGKPCQGKALENGLCFAHQPKEAKNEKDVCGHINKHNFDYDKELGHSVLTDVACDMPDGHKGDHSSVKYAVDFQNGEIAWEGKKRVYWNDTAGTPADEIKPDPSSLSEDNLNKELNRREEQRRRNILELE